MSTDQFDLVIIGGGITGAGAARDAAMRGMKVALIEASDYASGTSSRSSKLIHGGIRYLENLEFKLVFEALSERRKLFEIAPHLVHPLRFMIPLYRGGRVGMLKMGLGMWLYDALSLFRAPKLHERLNLAETQSRMSSLQSQELMGSYVYSDAYMDDDRLTLETLRSANEFSACCANFVKAIGAEFDADKKIKAVHCQDVLSGEKFSLRGKHVISCVGPWTDELAKTLFDQWKPILRPTKGVHLTFEKSKLPLSSAVVMGAESRIVFGIPRHEMVIVGTTDTDFKGSPSEVATTPEDVKYLLGVIDQYFPGAKISEKDIVASYAGVRPLVQDGSATEGKTSREHTIFTDEHQITFVAGGKYTTYRLMAEQIVDEALKYRSDDDKLAFKECQTDSPLNPNVTSHVLAEAHSWIDRVVRSGRLSKGEAQLLVERHGMEAEEILSLNSGYNYWQLEAAHALETTMCLHLVDFYTRRVHLFLANADHGLGVLNEIAQVFATYLGWTAQQTELEIQRLKDFVEKELRWKKALQITQAPKNHLKTPN